MHPITITQFNQLAPEEQTGALLRCCACPAWARRVLAEGPFDSAMALMAACKREWHAANEAEILEAFTGHPRIGDSDGPHQGAADQAKMEQHQVTLAADDTLARLDDGNRAYLNRFGFIFIICATGKPADEILRQLEARLTNTRAQELATGATEQGAIMLLRLEKLFALHS